MLKFKCPRCSVDIPLWPGFRQRFSRQGRRGKHQCPSCGAWIALRNGYFLSLACGLVLGAIGGASLSLPWTSQWDRLAVSLALAVILGFTAALLIVRFGRWQVLADGYQESPEFTRWSRVMNTSAWIGVATLFVMQLAIGLEWRHLVSRLPAAQTMEAIGVVIHRTELAVGVTFGAGVAVTLVTIAISIRAAVRRQRARDAENQSAP